MSPAETREQARQRIKKNIQRRSGSAPVTERIEVDFFDSQREGNQKFFNLLDFGRWQELKSTYKDPTNKKSLPELVGELLEGK